MYVYFFELRVRLLDKVMLVNDSGVRVKEVIVRGNWI